MGTRVRADRQGDIVIPGGTFAMIEPDREYTVVRLDNRLYVVPAEDDKGLLAAEQRQEKQEKYWAETTPERRAKDFLEWANQPRPKSPVLPDEALHRESFYDL